MTESGRGISFDKAETWLCRCGHSATKPFSDESYDIASVLLTAALQRGHEVTLLPVWRKDEYGGLWESIVKHTGGKYNEGIFRGSFLVRLVAVVARNGHPLEPAWLHELRRSDARP